MKFSSQGVPETLAGRYLLQFRGRCPPPFPPFTWPPHPELRWLPPPSFLSHPSPHSPVSHSEFKRRLPLSPLPPPPPYLRPSRADGARRRERGAKKQGPRGARRCGGDARRRVTVRSSAPSRPAGRGCAGSPRGPGAGVCEARACARGCVRGRGGAPGGRAAAAAAALGLRGHRPPPRVPPPPSLPLQFAPRLGFERSGAGSGSPAARTACGRAGDAGPPRARSSPGPGPCGKGLNRRRRRRPDGEPRRTRPQPAPAAAAAAAARRPGAERRR